MVTKKTYTLGVLCSYPQTVNDPFSQECADRYFYRTLRGVESVCRQAGYHCLYTICNLEDVDEFIHPRAMRDGSVDGVILVGYTSRAVAGKLAAFGIPCVQIGSNVDPQSEIECVYADLEKALEQAVSHYAQEGKRRCDLVLSAGPGPETLGRAFLRLRQTYPSIELHLIHSSRLNPTYEDMKQIGAEIGNRAAKPEIIIANLSLSAGLVDGLAECHRVCKQDYELMTICSHITETWLPSVRGSLSAIVFSLNTIGQLAAKRILARLDAPNPPGPRQADITVPCELVYAPKE